MKKYQLYVIRTEYGGAEIEGEDEDDARDVALSGNQDFHWENEEIEILEIKELDDTKEQ